MQATKPKVTWRDQVKKLLDLLRNGPFGEVSAYGKTGKIFQTQIFNDNSSIFPPLKVQMIDESERVIGFRNPSIASANTNSSLKIATDKFTSSDSSAPISFVNISKDTRKYKHSTIPMFLLLISTSQFGWTQLPHWEKPCKEMHVPFIKLTVAEGTLMGSEMMRKRIFSSLRESVPKEQHSNVAVYSGDFSEYKTLLGINNRLPGYAYLIDDLSQIRFRCCAIPTVQDVDMFADAVKMVRNEHHQRNHPSSIPTTSA